MWRHGNFRARAWVPACNVANLTPLPKIHGLRHLHVAEMIREGATLPQIRVRLGHESITTTLNTYGMLVEEVGDDVLERFAARRDQPVVVGGTVIRGELGG
jgi:integrase